MLFITGDKHGEVEMHMLSNNHQRDLAEENLTKNDHVWILGDFGLFWNNVRSKAEKYWLDWLRDKPYTVGFLDGNHENFSLINAFDEVDFLGARAGQAYDNIYHLKRGQIYSYDNKSLFVFGGAASHDKEHRIEHLSWWREEETNFKEIDAALENLKGHNNSVDFILTHTLPLNVIQLLGFPTTYTQCATAQFLQNIAETVQFKRWYCGHMHMEKTIGKFNILHHSIKRII